MAGAEPEPGFGLGLGVGVEPKLLPEPNPLPDPKLLPKLELPTGVDVLLAGWPTMPVFPAWLRISVSGS